MAMLACIAEGHFVRLGTLVVEVEILLPCVAQAPVDLDPFSDGSADERSGEPVFRSATCGHIAEINDSIGDQQHGAGSAATEMTTAARRMRGGYVLNGTKHWITGGGVSRLHLIFARIIEADEDRGIGAFLAVRGRA